MISCPTVEKRVIRNHYNISTVFYRLLWGQHLHHGLWFGNESPAVAARQLTERLAAEMGIARDDRVIDIGCGMGGSSIHLARHLNCQVTGITISPFQKRWAGLSSLFHRTSGRTRFVCGDAETVMFPASEFDAAWSIECTEHLFDKPAFFRRMADWVRPGGQLGICAWLAGHEPLDEPGRQRVYDVCEGFFCPSLGTMADYQQWITDAGFRIRSTFDWTDQVSRTWEVCKDRIERYRIRPLARLIDRGQLIFLDRFQTLLDAYRTGAMRYGCFIADKVA